MTAMKNITYVQDVDAILDELNAHQARRFIPVVVYTASLMVPGFIGNALTLFIYLRRLTKPSTKRLFVLCLAIFDFLACSILMPTEICIFFNPYHFPSDIMCKLMRATFYYIPVSSVSTLLLISLERYRKICCPLKWQITLPMAKRCLCIGYVGVSVVLSLPATVMHGATTIATGVENVTGVGCHVTPTFQRTVYPSVYSLTMLVVTLAALTHLLVCYGLIYRQVLRHVHFNEITISTISLKKYTGTHHDIVTSSSSSTPDCRSSEKHGGKGVSMLKVTKVMFVVTIVFIISFLPHSCLELLVSIDTGFISSLTDLQFSVYEIALRSHMVHQMANPIIYGLLDNSYRQECKQILVCICIWKASRNDVIQ